MNSLFDKYIFLFWFLLVLASVIFTGFKPFSKQTAIIILHNEPLNIAPKEFYIAGVTDSREDKTAVAWLLPVTKNSETAKSYPVDLKGGALEAIREFIANSLPINKGLHPIQVNIIKFMVKETALPGGRVEGKVFVNLSFNLERDETLEHLVDYNGNASYTRSAGPPQEVEPVLRHLLGNGLVFLDTWMNRQTAGNIKLAKSVEVSFIGHKEKPEGDTIYYSINRPLTWDDFQSNIPHSSRYDAEIYPSISYNEQTKINNGVILLNLDVNAYVPKSAGWVKNGNRNAYTLNHEQRHFDIAKIAAEHFKQKIKTEKLTVGNYDGPINVDYLDAYREMDSLQLKYDQETSHGENEIAQQHWNEQIDKELKD